MEAARKRTKSGLKKIKFTAPRHYDWLLHLYIAGRGPKAIAAVNNLKMICEEQLNGRYRLEVIDLLKRPRLARENQIIAVPTLVRKLPRPVRNVIGDLSNTERVLAGLDIVVSGAR